MHLITVLFILFHFLFLHCQKSLSLSLSLCLSPLGAHCLEAHTGLPPFCVAQALAIAVAALPSLSGAARGLRGGGSELDDEGIDRREADPDLREETFDLAKVFGGSRQEVNFALLRDATDLWG